jgi:hypothetical protein
VGEASGPPPAWIETATGDRWLAFSSFCWKTTCVDFLPPEMRPELPRLTVRRGESVRFHLGFVPRAVTVTAGGKTARLAARRIASWRAPKGGIVVVNARGTGGSASYVARLTLR